MSDKKNVHKTEETSPAAVKAAGGSVNEDSADGLEFDSPEGLENYIKIVSPASFLLLFALVSFFVAFIVFAMSISLDGEIILPAVCEDGEMRVFLGEGEVGRVNKSDRVIIDGHIFYLEEMDEVNDIETKDYLYARSNANIDEGEMLYEIILDTDFPDGYYTASVIFDSKRPLDEF